VADAVAQHGTDALATITASATIYAARQARKIALRFERYDRVLFGDDQIDGREGIVNVALENERRSLENRDSLRQIERTDPRPTND
jgi:hypothetical protein